METPQRRLKLGAEISILEIVNGAREGPLLLIVGGHTAATCAQVGIIVRAVEQVGRTVLLGYGSEKSSHINKKEWILTAMDERQQGLSFRAQNYCLSGKGQRLWRIFCRQVALVCAKC